jgi:threonine dehydrogenase-like Zn-dependent dehydrogenase
MSQLLANLVRWDVRPERTVTNRFSLAEAGEAYKLADAGTAGKVSVVFD